MAEITADQAADFLVALSQDAGDPVTNLKLQKLLYYSQGWYLALKNRPLFDDPIQAWPHGPVVPRIYGRFKGWRWDPIGQEIAFPIVLEETAAHLKEVMEVYGVFTAFQLERMTHQERPWRTTRGNLAPDEPSNEVITQELMQDYFSAVSAGQE